MRTIVKRDSSDGTIYHFYMLKETYNGYTQASYMFNIFEDWMEGFGKQFYEEIKKLNLKLGEEADVSLSGELLEN